MAHLFGDLLGGGDDDGVLVRDAAVGRKHLAPHEVARVEALQLQARLPLQLVAIACYAILV